MTFTDSFFQIFDKLMEQIGIVIDWTSQNVVPYATDLALRIVKFDTINHLIIFSVCIIYIIVVAILFSRKKFWKWAENADPLGAIVTIFLSAGLIFATPSTYTNGKEAIKNIIVPEITIIEIMQDMLESQ